MTNHSTAKVKYAKNPVQTISLTLPYELSCQLASLAEQYNVTRHALMKSALLEGLPSVLANLQQRRQEY